MLMFSVQQQLKSCILPTLVLAQWRLLQNSIVCTWVCNIPVGLIKIFALIWHLAVLVTMPKVLWHCSQQTGLKWFQALEPFCLSSHVCHCTKMHQAAEFNNGSWPCLLQVSQKSDTVTHTLDHIQSLIDTLLRWYEMSMPSFTMKEFLVLLLCR